MEFFKKCSESSDSSKKLKILKSIFSNTKWVKTLEKIFNNLTFQKNAKIVLFVQKIEILKSIFPIQNGTENHQKLNVSKK